MSTSLVTGSSPTSVAGLSSGLDTTSLINSLMAVEALPQTALKNKASDTQTLVTALQGLNSQIASLATLSAAAAAPAALDLYAASSNSTSVTATATSGASAGQLDIVVGAVAQSQAGVTAAMTTFSGTALTLVGSDGTKTDITANSSSLDDVVTAINAAGKGISATKVASGTDANGAAQYRIQVTGTSTGAAGAFSLYQGTSSQVSGGTATDLLTAPGAAVTRTAQDASVTLWAGTAASQTITSSTNTFSNLLPGVSVTVSAASTTPATITVARDSAQISSMAQNLVSSLNTVFAAVSTQTAVTASTDASGAPIASAGVFTGDSTVRDANQSILDAASLPVNGHSPSEIGISITSTGTLTFDSAKFSAALTSNPALVTSITQTIASRVSAAATQASDKYTGTLTTKITGQQTLITNLSSQISDWDTRLATRKATLEQTYATLEVTLNNLKSQSSWLSSQIAAFPVSTTSSSSTGG
jgi:flagellar hook-associated protein 2